MSPPEDQEQLRRVERLREMLRMERGENPWEWMSGVGE